jgi:hypothetical protein
VLDHIVMPNSINEGSSGAAFLACDGCQRQVTQLASQRDIATGSVV